MAHFLGVGGAGRFLSMNDRAPNAAAAGMFPAAARANRRSEEHTSELQSLMRNSYAVFCLKKKKGVPKPHSQRSTESRTHTTDVRAEKQNTHHRTTQH